MTPRNLKIAGAIAVVAVLGWCLAFETVTRKVVAVDAVCTACHLPWEFASTARLSATKPHPATPEGGQAACVDCHLPAGFLNSANAWFHFVSLTDLFGHFRDIDGERKGEYVTMRAKTAYRVRDRLHESDSSTCRNCHVESEIKPKRERGINAHQLALDEKKTCIECHYNLVHRSVDLKKSAAAGGEADAPEARSEK
nr:NapC/NirT family cytochrome c [Aromatoleum aromaticum]